MKGRIQLLLGRMEPVPTGAVPRIRPLPGIRAVIYDIYGTLLVSGSGDVGTAEAVDDTAALADALAAVGLADVEAKPGLERFHGAIRDTHAAARASGTAFPEIDVRETWRQALNLEPDVAERLAVEFECRSNPSWPMPGFPAVTDRLRGQGLRLGIVSNAQFYTPLVLEALTGRTVAALGFEDTLCAWSYRHRVAKPAPDLFAPVIRALATDDIRPSEALYVGNDMLNDVSAASRCGLRTALFAGDARSLRMREDHPDCAGVTPDAIVTRLEQVLELVGG